MGHAMADVSGFYDGIISPRGGLYKPGPQVVMPGAPSELTTRNVQTVAVDPFTGSPIVSGDGGNMPATRAALGLSGNAYALASPGVRGGGTAPFGAPIPGPDGYTVADKSQERLPPGILPENPFPTQTQMAFANMRGPSNAAHNAILKATSGEQFGGDPGNAGLFGLKMSPNIPPQQPPGATMAPLPNNPQVTAAMASRGTPAPAAPTIVGPAVAAPNGYMYAPTSNGSFVQVGKANPSLTPAQQYAAAAASAHRPTNAAERLEQRGGGGGFDGRGGGGGLT